MPIQPQVQNFDIDATLVTDLVAQYGSPLLMLDCEQVRDQYLALAEALPGVRLHYALKPLPHPAVVRTLLQLGACFDLATSGEVDLVREQGVPAECTIHTHPIKRRSDIADALEYGCQVFVVDNQNELAKFREFAEQAEVLIRLSFRNSEAYADLSKKFGCSPADAMNLIRQAQQWGIRVKGLSFHVGSQTANADKYVAAIQACKQLMDDVVAEGLPALSCLDIGGGFPVSYASNQVDIRAFCAPINAALAELPETVQRIAEPGRFIVAGAMTCVASVMGQAQREGRTWYYLDDGIYGSFSGLMFDMACYPLRTLKTADVLYPSVLAGPTCDSIDVICDAVELPQLEDGDLVITRMMGAYTSATATDFNFFKRATTVVLNEVFQLHQAEFGS
ncbi:type III PLP-dependent enzyme [Pseudoalteromonas sp. R3]|uniref:type III PLP-dependent enzyme n=1 Tax=Pseudoalteromonas sp. R3 TaxID=1709477 RepID=UPI0006B5D414|nr:type III PLP-dependent enzyme [Pseudoalteromonas sp. R3]AZZ97506.1 type III PLP-dependent enzyme [Pseudoalteromonas sp. R3]